MGRVPARELAIVSLARTLQSSGGDRYQYRPGRLPLEVIIVLPQPRQTFENIAELAEDVADKGMLNAPVVARFTKAGFQRYLAVINALWKTHFSIRAFKPKWEHKRAVYYVLLAGERRYRACKFLVDEGCSSCRDAGKTANGACFRKHFGKALPVRLCLHIPPLQALFLQLSENTHIRVPEHEEAHAYAQLFRLIREAEPEYPLARFARRVGRSPETVRRAIRFCELPVHIQELVEQELIRYGIALEISRLQAIKRPDDELLWWATRAMTSRATVPRFHELVSNTIEHILSGQLSLLDVMTAEAERELRRVTTRRTVARESIQALWQSVGYIGLLVRLTNQGLLGESSSPFSSRSPRRVLRAMLDMLGKLDAHLGKLMGIGNAQAMREECASLTESLERLERTLPCEGVAVRQGE